MIQFFLLVLLLSQTESLKAMQKYMLGYEFYSEGKYAEAVELFQGALALDSTLIDVYSYYGQALMKSGYLDSARTVYEKLVQRYPNDASIHYNLSLILIEKEMYGKAEEEISKAIEIDPAVPMFYYARSIVNCYWQCDIGKAEDDLYKVLELQPNMYLAIFLLGDLLENQGKTSEAYSLYRVAQKYDPESVSDYCSHGELSMRLMNWENAVEVFLEVYEVDPDYEDIQLNIAICYDNMGDIGNATKYYCEALEHNPDDPSIYVSLGYLYEETGNLTAAKDIYRKALHICGDSVDFYVDLARMYNQLENDSCWLWAKRAVEKFPDRSLPYACLGWFYSDLDSLNKAAEYAKKALLLDSASAYNWCDMGHVFYEEGMLDSAILYYNTAIRYDSLDIESYIWLSHAYIETQRFTKALNACNNALILDSTNMYILLNLGSISLFSGDTNTAFDYFINTVRLYPDCYEAYRPLFKICLQKGNSEILKQELLRIVKKQQKYSLPFFVLCNVYGSEAKYDSALLMIKQAIKLDSDDADFHFTAGTIYIDLCDYNNALKSFKHALYINPSDSSSTLGICEVLYRTGEYTEAKTKLVDLCKKHPNFPYAHYLLGMIYTRENNYSAVLREFNRYLQLAPDAKNRDYVEKMMHEVKDLLEK